MPESNRRFILRSRPDGRITPETFELVEEAIPEIQTGEALVRTQWISLDPTNRTWINETPTYLPPVAIGEVMRGVGLGQVAASKHDAYRGRPARGGSDRLASGLLHPMLPRFVRLPRFPGSRQASI